MIDYPPTALADQTVGVRAIYARGREAFDGMAETDAEHAFDRWLLRVRYPCTKAACVFNDGHDGACMNSWGEPPH